MGILIKIIVDIIMGPFLWLSARKLSKNPEWRDTQAKVKELTQKADRLMTKGKKLQEDYDKFMAVKEAKAAENKSSIGAPKISNRYAATKLKALNASKSDYYNKNIKLCGYLSISTHYYNGYDNADDTHYSFILTDKNGYTAQVYFKKGISKTLFNKLIKTDDLLVNIDAIPDKTKNKDNHDDILLEGIKYEILSL